MRPRLLDLFCGAGGAAVGYHRAGFEVVGVDIVDQPNYPYEFHQADALTFPLERFDAIHASPPCQRHSTATRRWGRNDEHPDLIPATRLLLETSGLRYVIENVPGSPLLAPVLLCGSMFDLGADGRHLRRHRLFETNFPLSQPTHLRHQGRAIGVYGNAGGSSRRDGLSFATTEQRREAMGIDWMSGRELAQAIPPAYTEFIGRQLIEHGDTLRAASPDDARWDQEQDRRLRLGLPAMATVKGLGA